MCVATASAVVAAYNLGLVVRRKQALHTVLERKEEVVARKAAAEAAHRMKEAAVPTVAHTAVEVADKVVARRAAVVADSNLVAAVGLDRKTWIIPSCLIDNHFSLVHSR